MVTTHLREDQAQKQMSIDVSANISLYLSSRGFEIKFV